MPEKKTMDEARRAKRQGKSPSTQAGAFVHEEIEHVRDGKHGARSTKQVIAIGLSKARRAGVKLPAPPKRSTKRARAVTKALKREPKRSVSTEALSRQAKAAAQRRPARSRKAAAKKAARTRARNSES